VSLNTTSKGGGLTLHSRYDSTNSHYLVVALAGATTLPARFQNLENWNSDWDQTSREWLSICWCLWQRIMFV